MNEERKEELREDVKLAPFKEAGLLQMNAPQFNCEITELAVAGGGNARIAVEGTPDNLQRLYDYVNGALNDESKKAPTV